MNFKKSKQQVAEDASWRAHNAINYRLQSLHNSPMTNIGNTVTDAVREGIKEAITSMIEDIYTDEEFEQDLTLRSKA